MIIEVLQGTTACDLYLSTGSARITTLGFYLANDIQTFRDLSKHNVLAIQPGSIASADKELAAIGIGTSVGHTHCTGSTVCDIKILVGKLLSENALSSRSVSIGKITSVRIRMQVVSFEL